MDRWITHFTKQQTSSSSSSASASSSLHQLKSLQPTAQHSQTVLLPETENQISFVTQYCRREETRERKKKKKKTITTTNLEICLSIWETKGCNKEKNGKRQGGEEGGRGRREKNLAMRKH